MNSSEIQLSWQELQRSFSSGMILFILILLYFYCLQVRLVDAGFVWTEPHSKRIKVKLTIQKEVR